MNLDSLNLNFRASPVFYANKLAYDTGKYRIIVNQGGSRSGKTYSIIMLLILIALSNQLEISVVAITRPHLTRGALKDFLTIMKDYNLYSDNNFNRTNLVYSFDNGSYIEFFSVENGDKIRGHGRDLLFINEANLLSYDEWEQLIIRTRKSAFIDYNPSEETYIQSHILTRDDHCFIHSTYLDNYDFLSSIQIKEIERLAEIDEVYWKIYGLGELAQAGNIIYHNYNIEAFEDIEGEAIYGLDFGFNNPSALIKAINKDNVIYLQEMLYQSNLTNTELINKIKSDNLVGNKYDYIYSDNDPGRIEEFYQAGFNIRPADKNVKNGIDYVKNFKLILDPNSPNLIKEFKHYKWKEDKNGRVFDEPVKFNDHAIDAVRYALYTHGLNFWTENAVPVLPDLNSLRHSSFNQYQGF